MLNIKCAGYCYSNSVVLIVRLILQDSFLAVHLCVSFELVLKPEGASLPQFSDEYFCSVSAAVLSLSSPLLHLSAFFSDAARLLFCVCFPVQPASPIFGALLTMLRNTIWKDRQRTKPLLRHVSARYDNLTMKKKTFCNCVLVHCKKPNVD